jgi:membrane-associated phospholipid phosphatase
LGHEDCALVRWSLTYDVVPMAIATREEHALLSAAGRDLLIGALLALATAIVFLAVGLDATQGWVQKVDDRFLRVMVSHRTQAFTFVAHVFNWLGVAVVTFPVRIGVAGYLAFRRRWWHFSAFVLAMVVSEVLIGTLKSLYGRPRPPIALALVGTSGGSFPSGHAVAASVTAVAIVLALFPAGRHRLAWGVAAALFSFVMALSRAYLAAHWLSDAIAGTLLGTTVALGAALLVQWMWDVSEARGDGRGDPAGTTLAEDGAHR